MPVWPFLMLGAIFVAVLVVPPLLAAYVDYRMDVRRRPPGAGNSTEPGGGPRATQPPQGDLRPTREGNE